MRFRLLQADLRQSLVTDVFVAGPWPTIGINIAFRPLPADSMKSQRIVSQSNHKSLISRGQQRILTRDKGKRCSPKAGVKSAGAKSEEERVLKCKGLRG